jgi:hypothetical protein
MPPLITTDDHDGTNDGNDNPSGRANNGDGSADTVANGFAQHWFVLGRAALDSRSMS